MAIAMDAVDLPGDGFRMSGGMSPVKQNVVAVGFLPDQILDVLDEFTDTPEHFRTHCQTSGGAGPLAEEWCETRAEAARGGSQD